MPSPTSRGMERHSAARASRIRTGVRWRAQSPDSVATQICTSMMNMFWGPLDFEVPVDPQRAWHIAVDTFASGPQDIAEQDERAPFRRALCTVQGRSIVVLVGTNP